MDNLTQYRLKKLLVYQSDSGTFIRKVTRGRSRIGERAGCQHRNGYIQICVDGRLYLEHRLAWFYMTGKWPPHEIDHINRVRNDNRWNNLRLATRSINSHRVLRLALKGAFLDKRRTENPWYSQITINKKRYCLGTFPTAGMAHLAYSKAASRLFGIFAD